MPSRSYVYVEKDIERFRRKKHEYLSYTGCPFCNSCKNKAQFTCITCGFCWSCHRLKEEGDRILSDMIELEVLVN